ncbi:MAG: MFS transporter [Chloroflexi bacterium]|nr:MFS transporter [Chloroflexota bacterium]
MTQSDRPSLRRAVSALESPDFRLLFLAGFVAAIGGTLQQTANLWQIYEITGSALLLGLTGIARAIPIIGLSLIGGVIADRVNRRWIIMSGQIANGVVALALGALTLSGLIEAWHIYVGTMITTAFGALSAPARQAIVPNLVPRHQLVNAVALNFSVFGMARIIAPAIAGIAIATIGLSITYAATGVAFVVTFFLLGRINLGATPAKPRESAFRAMIDGLRFIRHRRTIILVLLGTDAAAMLFGSYQVLMPILAERLDAGPTGYGLLWSADAVGAVLGAALIASLGDFPYKGFVCVASILAYCVALAGMALAPWLPLAMIACLALGVTDSMQATSRNGVIQLLTPDEYRGRVSSFQQMSTIGVPSIGQGLLGVAAGVVGAPIALVSGAIACALINIGILAARKDLRAKDIATLATLDEDQPELEPMAAR